MCLPCRLRGQSQQHRGWWRVCKTSSTLCYWLCSENQEAHSRLWFRILPIYRRVVQEIYNAILTTSKVYKRDLVFLKQTLLNGVKAVQIENQINYILKIEEYGETSLYCN